MAKVASLLTSMNVETNQVEAKWYDCKKDELVTIPYPSDPNLKDHKIEISMGRRAVIRLQEKADSYLQKNAAPVDDEATTSNDATPSEADTKKEGTEETKSKKKVVAKKSAVKKPTASKKAAAKA